MKYLLIITGVLLLIGGIITIHFQNRATYWGKKLISISVTMVGAILLWFIAADNISPVRNVEFKILSQYQDGMIISFKANNSRSCKIEQVDTSLMINNGSIKADSTILYTTKQDDFDIGFILVKNERALEADAIEVKVKHFCPFGFELETEPTDLPLRKQNQSEIPTSPNKF